MLINLIYNQPMINRIVKIVVHLTERRGRIGPSNFIVFQAPPKYFYYIHRGITDTETSDA
jgi:hypothetical protein